MPTPQTVEHRRLKTEDAPWIVLDILLERHPALVSMEELVRESSGTAYAMPEAEVLAKDGVAELTAGGLAHKLDRFVFASRTAVRSNQLSLEARADRPAWNAWSMVVDETREEAKRVWYAQLSDETAQAGREAYCRLLAEALTDTGDRMNNVAMIDPFGRAVGLVARIGASLCTGACTLLDASNPYGAAALIRQLIEVEYLLWVFAEEPSEYERWATTDHRVDHSFKPSANRKRADGRFRVSEYQVHCEQGGHPHPNGVVVLDYPHYHRTLWLDLADHAGRVWHELTCCCAAVGRPAITDHYAYRVQTARAAWQAVETCDDTVLDLCREATE